MQSHMSMVSADCLTPMVVWCARNSTGVRGPSTCVQALIKTGNHQPALIYTPRYRPKQRNHYNRAHEPVSLQRLHIQDCHLCESLVSCGDPTEAVHSLPQLPTEMPQSPRDQRQVLPEPL